jgi:hypothetical protein
MKPVDQSGWTDGGDQNSKGRERTSAMLASTILTLTIQGSKSRREEEGLVLISTGVPASVVAPTISSTVNT